MPGIFARCPWLLLVLCLVGCGSRASGLDLAPVEGTVKLDGVPLKSGLVSFVPDEAKGASGPVAIAEIDAEGKYKLKTLDAEGALVGFHHVRVVGIKPGTDPTKPPEYTVPQKYGDPKSKLLTFEVKKVEKNVYDIELSSK